MQNAFVLLFSALFFIGILSPLLMFYALAIIVHVVVVNPLMHVYRIVRYGVQYEPGEPV